MAVTLDFESSIGKVKSDLTEMKNDLTGVNEAYEKIGQTEKEVIAGARKNQESLAKATKNSDLAFNRQGKTVQQLSAHVARLSKAQKKTNDPALVKKYNAEIVKTQLALKLAKGESVSFFAALSAGATTSQAVFISLKGVLASTFAPLFAVGAILGTLREVISLSNEFQQSGADLQAITGASDEALEFLKQSAVEVGVETTVSANKTLEAYKLIASAKPELLSNAEGLAQITKDAVTLTEAMGGELPQVATDLTDIMNKMKAPAEESGRFINALAAGSKEGSAEVGQLASSFLVAGTEIQSSNVKLEEGVGIFEALAEQGLKGAEAGTAARNVFSKLSATDVLPKDATDRLKAAGVDITALSDKSLTFTDRLRALAPIQNDANALTALFGLENKSAAQILLGNVDRIDELTEAVTGTNVAQEQAAIRTATASAEWEKLKNTISSLVVDSGGGLSSFLALIISFGRNGILFIKGIIDDFKPTITLLTDAFGDLFDAIASMFPATEEGAEGIDLFGTAIKAITFPLKLLINIFVGIVDGITLFYEWAGQAINRSKPLTDLFRNLRLLVIGVFQAITDAPAYLEGGIAAIRVFITEVSRSILDLGGNIGNVLKEAFNIKKLVTDGTGDLDAALGNLFVNPFKGVGAKAAEAFNQGFADSQKGNKIAAPESTGSTSTPATPVETAATSTFSKQDEQAKAEAEKARKAREKAAKERIRLEKEIAKARIDALRDGTAKELALEELRFKDLSERLEKHGIDTSQALEQHELNKFEIKRKGIADVAQLDQLGGEEKIRFLFEQAKQEIETLEAQLTKAGGGKLLESQIKQLDLLRKTANDQFLKDLEAFQSEELKLEQDHEIALLELKAGDFETAVDFEEFKQQEILNIRLRFAEAQLAILEKIEGAESDAALGLRKIINEIKGDLEGLTGDTPKDFNLFDLIGLDPDDPRAKGIETFIKTSVGVLGDLNKARLENADEAIKAIDDEIEAIEKGIEGKEKELEEQEALAEQGKANRVAEVQAELDLLRASQEAEKVERDKAVAEKKKIQKQQAIIDTVTQASSLITASAQVFQSVAAIPFVGPIIGAALVATMIGSFIAAKSKIFQGIKKQKARKGMFGKVTGYTHDQGGEAFGDHIEVEAGENFGILSRKASRKFGKHYEAFTNAANKNDRQKMAEIAAELSDTPLDRNLPNDLAETEAKIVQMKTEITANLEGEELRKNNALLAEMIKDKRKPKVVHLEGSRVETHGNSTRIIKKKNIIKNA